MGLLFLLQSHLATSARLVYLLHRWQSEMVDLFLSGSCLLGCYLLGQEWEQENGFKSCYHSWDLQVYFLVVQQLVGGMVVRKVDPQRFCSPEWGALLPGPLSFMLGDLDLKQGQWSEGPCCS